MNLSDKDKDFLLDLFVESKTVKFGYVYYPRTKKDKVLANKLTKHGCLFRYTDLECGYGLDLEYQIWLREFLDDKIKSVKTELKILEELSKEIY